jgi:hypothetical protein
MYLGFKLAFDDGKMGAEPRVERSTQGRTTAWEGGRGAACTKIDNHRLRKFYQDTT